MGIASQGLQEDLFQPTIGWCGGFRCHWDFHDPLALSLLHNLPIGHIVSRSKEEESILFFGDTERRRHYPWTIHATDRNLLHSVNGILPVLSVDTYFIHRQEYPCMKRNTYCKPSRGVTRRFCARCDTGVTYPRPPLPEGWPDLFDFVLGTMNREDWDTEGIGWIKETFI